MTNQTDSLAVKAAKAVIAYVDATVFANANDPKSRGLLIRYFKKFEVGRDCESDIAAIIRSVYEDVEKRNLFILSESDGTFTFTMDSDIYDDNRMWRAFRLAVPVEDYRILRKWMATLGPSKTSPIKAERSVVGAYHPGEYLRDEIVERGREFEILRRKSALSAKTVDALVAGKRSITRPIAASLAQILGTGKQIWLRLQDAYDKAIQTNPDHSVDANKNEGAQGDEGLISQDVHAEFKRDLAAVINTHSRENESNTPDFILALYLDRCLWAFERAIEERTKQRESPPDLPPRPKGWNGPFGIAHIRNDDDSAYLWFVHDASGRGVTSARYTESEAMYLCALLNLHREEK